MDLADLAQIEIELALSSQIKNIRSSAAVGGSLLCIDCDVEIPEQRRAVLKNINRCIDCDEKIPEERKLAVKGCIRCIDCQTYADSSRGF